MVRSFKPIRPICRGCGSISEPFYSSTGRPSVDPELMIRMLIVGYCFGIRSERRLCDEVHLQSGLSLVLPASASTGRCQTTPSQRPSRPLPRQPICCVTSSRRASAGCMVEGLGRRRRLCGRCQLDQGGRQPPAVRAGAQTGSTHPSRTGPSTNISRSSMTPPSRRDRGDAQIHLAGGSAARWTRALRGPAFFAYSDNFSST